MTYRAESQGVCVGAWPVEGQEAGDRAAGDAPSLASGVWRQQELIGSLSHQSQTAGELIYGKQLVCDRSPAETQYRYVTTGGRSVSDTQNTQLNPTTSSIHPLTPLLLYNDRLLPSASPYSQPISGSTAAAHTRTHPHGNNLNSRLQVKKPLNAFMLFMKEKRHDVLREGTLRESAAINRVLGHRWHSLSRTEQSKYYELAQKERELHKLLYPGWSARDNYGKRRRRKERWAAGDAPHLFPHPSLL